MAAHPGGSTTRVTLFTLGGTISMAARAGGGGVVARLSGSELLRTLANAAIDIDVRDIQAVSSGSLTFRDILEVVSAANDAVHQGVRGIVLTQGTDTIEETAFLVDSVWTHQAPFVLTGAMRNPTLPGPDGPANLVASIQVAQSDGARERGALVVFNDEIHSARHVRKTHTTSAATFSSPDVGALGHVFENVPHFLASVPPRTPVVGFSVNSVTAARVALYTATLDDDGALLPRIAELYDGLVVAGFGAGHVAGSLAPELGELAASMPVVLTSRTGSGRVLAGTYAAPGSERDLLGRGLISGGFVHPYKARVLLRLLIAADASRHAIAAAFSELG